MGKRLACLSAVILSTFLPDFVHDVILADHDVLWRLPILNEDVRQGACHAAPPHVHTPDPGRTGDPLVTPSRCLSKHGDWGTPKLTQRG